MYNIYKYIWLGTFFFSIFLHQNVVPTDLPTLADTVQIYDISFPQTLRIRSRIIGGTWSTWAQLELNEEAESLGKNRGVEPHNLKYRHILILHIYKHL